MVLQYFLPSLELVPFKRSPALLLAFGALLLSLSGCGGVSSSSSTPAPIVPIATVTPPTMAPTFSLTGDTTLVRDPTIIYQSGVYYAISTDPGDQAGRPQVGNLPIRCSTDKIAWTRCGQVFTSVPPAILSVFGSNFYIMWAPDVSYFSGLYHVYYAASIFGTNHSLIGLVTSPTMNHSDPAYKWTDQGIILSSQTSDNFNAIDPSILVDTDSGGAPVHVWLTYGSYWGGIYQREINPATGTLSSTNTTVLNLATRPGVANNPIEGPNLIKHNGYYYLFVSFDYCCQPSPSADNYKIAVGRSTSPQGPFVDQSGTPMLQAGGTIILQSGAAWTAPGGSSVLIDSVRGDVIAYHALSVASNYLPYLFVNSISWPNDWPAIQQ